MPIQIAIDGYSSCGKSTLAKALAKKLNFLYVDSGAMYRAVALYFLQKQIDPNKIEKIIPEIPFIKIEFRNHLIFLNGKNIENEIRDMKVANVVSLFARIKEIRDFLVHQQQEFSVQENVVMDGRDIGTAVFPNAQLKIFMTADPMIRAQRRYKELKEKNPENTSLNLEEIKKNLTERDFQDTTREISPLVKAENAIILDNSALNQEQQLELVLKELSARKLY